jgi:His Kinase A (phospho-acceptor) domain
MGTVGGSCGDFGDVVRYDSMLSTALALEAEDAGGRIAQWRQLVDLVVQAKGALNTAVREAALARIGELQSSVPVEQRRLAAAQLASRTTHGDGVALFGMDEPAIAAPILSVAQLDSEGWQTLIPKIPPASRAILRNRRDLPDDAVHALASYGLSDFSLPANDATGVDAGTQIRDLVARIEAFRLGSVGNAVSSAPTLTDEFNFETDPHGLFDWIAGVPREALIGLSIAEIADAGGYGVDGQAAGAFRRRAPFRDARLLVAGAGSASGDWLISAKPVFNPRDGRFAGYHGLARRPRPDEIAGPVANFAGTTMPVDSLRQLIHELRTPLNAILGFAEMIDRQLLGPAALAYRAQAQAIVQDGERLLAMVDDLDQAARARREAVPPDETSDAGAMLTRIVAGLQSSLAAREVRLEVVADSHVEVVGINPAVLERMTARLIGAVLSLAMSGETISVSLEEAVSGGARMSVARPQKLAGVSDIVLLDPGYDPETPYPDAPLLGLGFTLRLLESLARDIGGRFSISADAFILSLPGVLVHADLPAGTP